MGLNEGIDISQSVDGPRRSGFAFQGAVRDILVLCLGSLLGFGLSRGLIVMLHAPDRGLPYSDRFASGDNAEWSAYGGNWKVQNGNMVNESNERGAKLVTGSAYWQDYEVEADVALRSQGDAGIIARVSDPEQGVDAYRGIYAGLRVRDQALVIGMADHDWQESVAQPVVSPIQPNAWYRIQLRLSGCNLGVVVHREDKSELARKNLLLNGCPSRGKIGLRSYDSGGIWRNVRVTRLADLP